MTPQASTASTPAANVSKCELKQEQLERLRTLFQSVKNGDVARLEIGKRLYESGFESGQQDTLSRREHKLLILKVADEFGYAKSTLYRWQSEYKTSIGVPTSKEPDPEAIVVPHSGGSEPAPHPQEPVRTKFNPAGTRGFKNKSNLNRFVRRLMAIGANGITSPFPSTADYAFDECTNDEIDEVLYNLRRAISRLQEYEVRFQTKHGAYGK